PRALLNATRLHLFTDRTIHESCDPECPLARSPADAYRMMTSRSAWWWVALVLTLSCGDGGSNADADGERSILTSHQDLCAGAAPAYAGGYTTASGCAFEQHADNIAKY